MRIVEGKYAGTHENSFPLSIHTCSGQDQTVQHEKEADGGGEGESLCLRWKSSHVVQLCLSIRFSCNENLKRTCLPHSVRIAVSIKPHARRNIIKFNFRSRLDAAHL